MKKSRRRPGRPPTGYAQSPAERMRRYRARQRAAGLRAATRWQPATSAPLSPGLLKHRIIEARSLAMHCLIARKIEADRRLLDAAGRIAGAREIVVIGSQAVLGQFPEAPPALRRSMEADLYPKGAPELADKVDGAIGEGSRFHEQYGYYAQGVAPDTAMLPRG